MDESGWKFPTNYQDWAKQEHAEIPIEESGGGGVSNDVQDLHSNGKFNSECDFPSFKQSSHFCWFVVDNESTILYVCVWGGQG